MKKRRRTDRKEYRKKVYIAGKYSATNIIDILKNIKMGIRASVDALHEGYIPFCPFLDFLYNLIGDKPLTVEEYKEYSMEWLYSCDEIWLLPNWLASKGAKAELAEANKLGMKVVYL